MNEIDVCRRSIADSKIFFILNPHFWENCNPQIIEYVNTKDWKEVKFLDNNSGVLHASMSDLPNDKGGIYVFIAKPNIIPASHLYILYIGRSLITEKQNLRKRCSEYPEDARPKISRMISNWGKYLYIRYLPLEDNQLISELEIELINTILPPCNDKIPDKEIRDAVKAFSM
ncbi:MAG: hypothetical protein ACOWWO_02665 [Peptococcaceae bacterium]